MPLFVFSLASMALWVFCLVDVVTRDVRYIQHLPKTLWMVVILFVPVFGSVLWLVAGRGQRASPVYASVAAHVDAEGGRTVAAYDPAAEKAFRQECRERAEQQRRAGRQQRAEGDSGQT
ncbi:MULTISPECIES: PLD nuclease N-terminal domain-containing protein [Rhodococcus]|uniref:PLD nuclease N-terminal domain-containing protein n=1 Tax=Rhodococcus TaxID=1827 RepID=UPI00080638C5|nr:MULTISPECIES: PLD nuclease N-terminal domain-containing protein [Rhodococcus]ANQ73268.1 hypothetical protein AOT96_22260 [Rhodococcus sp. 008]MCZ4546172.1 PLD nuclease N-terminal domain-containing protein [Rhodococcus qingshengii]UGQ53320.1 PLD nuclease N-terminal domain-containing protein [Rhodococcus qingshengii]